MGDNLVVFQCIWNLAIRWVVFCGSDL